MSELKIPKQHNFLALIDEFNQGRGLQDQEQLTEFAKLLQQRINFAYIGGYKDGVTSVKRGESNG